MKLNVIASAVALGCLVAGTTVALATPHVAYATSKVHKGKHSKTHKSVKVAPKTTGGYG
jgi:hypothetical protein